MLVSGGPASGAEGTAVSMVASLLAVIPWAKGLVYKAMKSILSEHVIDGLWHGGLSPSE